MRADVVVVGAGPAGLASATRLAEAGRQVLVLARGNGFTHWGAGSVDVLGRVGGEPVERPLEAIDRLPEGHPYHLVGQAAVRDGLDWFSRFTAAAGLAHRGDPGAQPRPGHRLRHPAPDLPGPRAGAGELRGRVAVVNFAGFRDFSPAPVRPAAAPGRDRRHPGERAPAGLGPRPLLHRGRAGQGHRRRRVPPPPRPRPGQGGAGADVAVVPAVLGAEPRPRALGRPPVPGRDAAGRGGDRPALDPRPAPVRRLPGAAGGPRRALAVRLPGGRGGARRRPGHRRPAARAPPGCWPPAARSWSWPPAGSPATASRPTATAPSPSRWPGLPVDGLRRPLGLPGRPVPRRPPAGRRRGPGRRELRPVGRRGEPLLANVRCVGGLLAAHDPTTEGSREGVALATAARVRRPRRHSRPLTRRLPCCTSNRPPTAASSATSATRSARSRR
jgi:hypothetical protein